MYQTSRTGRISKNHVLKQPKECVYCHGKLLSDENYCSVCGEPIYKVCRTCGEYIYTDENFCPYCGMESLSRYNAEERMRKAAFYDAMSCYDPYGRMNPMGGFGMGGYPFMNGGSMSYQGIFYPALGQPVNVQDALADGTEAEKEAVETDEEAYFNNAKRKVKARNGARMRTEYTTPAPNYGVAALVLAIIGLFVPVIFSLIAIILGAVSMKACRKLSVAAIVISVISLLLWATGVVLFFYLPAFNALIMGLF